MRASVRCLAERGFPFLVLTMEEFVLVEQTIYLAVQQVELLRGLEPDAFECILVAGDDPRRGSCELELQRLAYIGIQVEDILVLP